MANIKANIKSIKKQKVTHTANHSKIATLKTTVKKANTANTVESLNNVYSYTDNLASKGVIHKNKANRIKSRTAIRSNKAKAALVEK